MNVKVIRAHLALLGAASMWGLMSPMGKAAMEAGITGLSLATMRMIGGAVCFWIASLFAPKEKVSSHDLMLLFFAGLLGIVCNQGCFTFGLSLTSPIDASIVTTTMPIVTMILAALFLKEPVTPKKVIGIFLGSIGALMLILSNQGGSVDGGGSILGDALCITAQVSFACYLTIFKKLISRYNVFTLMKWMFTYAAICCIPFSYNGLASINFTTLPTAVYADLAFIVFGATFLSYLLVPIGQHRLRPTLVTMYCYLQPIVASMLAVLWGMDRFTPTKGAAILLVFVGVYLVNRSKSRAQMEAEALEAARRTAPDAPAMPDVPESSGRS